MADQKSSSKQKETNWVQRVSENPLILGILLTATLVTSITGVVVIVQRITTGIMHHLDPPIVPIHLERLDRETISRFGLTFSYPSDWDRQNAPENLDGAVFVNPTDRAVSITGYGSLSPSVFGNGSLGDAVNYEKALILGMRDAKIDSEAASGTFIIGARGSRWDVDGWRVVYQYVDGRGRPMMVMEKLAVADRREVVLVMKAPANIFPRYNSAFLQLASELLLGPCQECISHQ
jgi:hypothetical protein